MLIWLLAGSTLAAAKPDCSAGKTPYNWPIVEKGPAFLKGYSVDKFEAWSLGALWQRVPVQIDEVNEKGDYVLSEGIPYTKATDDGHFDSNDELVFWGGDLGKNFALKDVPKFILKDVHAAWKLSWCESENHGSILLLAKKNPIKRLENAPHAKFTKDAITSSQYRYDFNKKNPALIGEVFIDGKEPVIKKSEYKMPLVLPWWLPNMTFDSSDFTGEIECWQEGPIRTIVAVGVKYSSFLFLKLHLFSELVFYRNKFEIPTVIEFSFDPSKYLKPGSGIVYSLDFHGEKLKIASNLPDLPKDAKSGIEVKASRSHQSYFAKVHTKQASFMMTVRIDEKARELIPPPFLIKKRQLQDENLIKNWSWLEELDGTLGTFIDLSQARKETYSFGLDLLLSSQPDESFEGVEKPEMSFNPITL